MNISLKLEDYIQDNWALDLNHPDNKKSLEAIIIINIMPNGEIKDITFEKESGNKQFDESAYDAIKKSNPLPELDVLRNKVNELTQRISVLSQ
jgi:TonB family protein